MRHINESDIQLLTDYENGKLSEPELEAVKRRLQTDKDFIKLHNELEELEVMIKTYFTKNEDVTLSPVRTYLNELEKTLTTANQTEGHKSVFTFNRQEFKEKKESNSKAAKKIISYRVFTKGNLMLAAASILLLFAAGILVKYNYSTEQEFFKRYYQPYATVEMSQNMGSVASMNELKTAYTAYETKQYSTAIHLFQKLLEQKEDPMVLFYMANAYLALGEDNKAIVLFETLDKNYKAFTLNEQVITYLCVAYLHTGEHEKARRKIIDLKHISNDTKKIQAFEQQLN
jgi:tetratricopeptide (TPR) repeat protein